ncbi:hypothetical protein [Candidatus Hodgkinia cicadicola]
MIQNRSLFDLIQWSSIQRFGGNRILEVDKRLVRFNVTSNSVHDGPA